MKKNEIILYNCKDCGKTIVVRQVDEGIPPFMIVCKHVGGCNEGTLVLSTEKDLQPGYLWVGDPNDPTPLLALKTK